MPMCGTFERLKRALAWGLLAEVAILGIAALLRFLELELKPPHFDEGINGWWVDQMRVTGFYRYDPENYHGPLYFYVLFLFLSLFGRHLWVLRLPAVLASFAAVWGFLKFDRFFGKTAARLAALAWAISPAAVFYGRYAIHESWLVCSMMLATWGLLGLWKDGGRRDLFAAVAGVTLMLLLKETAVIHLGCYVLAAGCLLLWQRVVPSTPSLPIAPRGWCRKDLILACGLSLLALVFFYSGTFLNLKGLGQTALALGKWFHTGAEGAGHLKPDYQVGPLNYYWIALLVRYEWPLVLGLVYGVRLIWPAPAIQRYLGIYAAGVLMAYSIVPYKTAWCMISVVWPFALLFGCAVDEIRQRAAFATLAWFYAGLLLLGSLTVCVRLNFFHPTDAKEPYVYVQTVPEMAVLTDPLLGMAARDPRNYGLGGEILLESYFPIPWVIGEFPRIGYYDKPEKIPKVLEGDFIVALSEKQDLVQGEIKEPYLRMRFHLRDSMDECSVWFKERVFKDWFAAPGHGTPEVVKPKSKGAEPGKAKK